MIVSGWRSFIAYSDELRIDPDLGLAEKSVAVGDRMRRIEESEAS